MLVCGSRDWTDRAMLDRILDKLAAVLRVETIIEGEQRGADIMAKEWARSRGVPFAPYPAEWSRYSKAAGRKRNQRMLDEGRPDLVVAFPLPASVGTWHMAEIALAAGVPVWVMPQAEAQIDALGEGVFGVRRFAEWHNPFVGPAVCGCRDCFLDVCARRCSFVGRDPNDRRRKLRCGNYGGHRDSHTLLVATVFLDCPPAPHRRKKAAA